MTIQWSIENGIGQLILNKPPANTMTMAFFRDFQILVQEISSNPALKAIVISGMGRHYSSGADIQELLRVADPITMLANYHAFAQLEQLNIPVISAIHGVCLGSAFELALFCHFRICGEDAVLGLPESTFNLMPGLGGIQQVTALAGKATALEIILRGITFTASDALGMGLVDAVVSKSKVIPLSMAFANSLTSNFEKADRNVYLHKFLKPLYANF
jgi:enoyl-CoA hydratase/carnithine racemase